ncbi:methionyl-tRNA formyltransferase family protein [Calycina marina]|uniref:methionyl-tRNA formyltransferase n=1 Tax=Calycina marina TaxID=1763456 RepID=A0A9P7YWW9_9HELO|nr:methionyl-tRNA formyltransferase family protein [Calycina marina]
MYLRALRSFSQNKAFNHFIRTYTTKQQRPSVPKVSHPLRILFCGSDDLSSACLRALYEEKQQDPRIKSIDVLIRPAKPYGRDLKKVREVPLKAVAEELGLEVHQRDTFTGWDLPMPDGSAINLIIAVSFGLFVPPRILNSALYSGINVHPSLLPNYRGPAPLQHILMNGENFTGVTVQTLDPVAFDHGTILWQTPQEHIHDIKEMHTLTYPQLLENITPYAAGALVQAIKARVFVPPLQDVGWYLSGERKEGKEVKVVHAHKITKADRQVDWTEISYAIENKYRALGSMWTKIFIDKSKSVRLILDDISIVSHSIDKIRRRLKEKRFSRDGKLRPHPFDDEIKFAVRSEKGDDRDDWHDGRGLLLYVEDGDGIIIACQATKNRALRVGRMTLEGKTSQSASTVMSNLEGTGFLSEPGQWILMKRTNKILALPRSHALRQSDGAYDQPSSPFAIRS